MRNCEYFINFIGNCDQKPDGVCIALDNDGVAGGKIAEELIKDAYRKFSTEILRSVVKAYSPGNIPGDICKAAPIIVTVITSVLEERGES